MTFLDTTPQPLATAAQFSVRFPGLVTDGPASEAPTLTEIMVEATSHIEERVDRRLAPFSGHIETLRLEGIDPEGMGMDSDMPIDIYGSLGMSQAAAYGTNTLVRDFWLEQTAPHRPDLWTYSIQSLTGYLAVGSTLPIDFTVIEGPWPDTGFCRLRLGTFTPVGTTLRVVYGGGYTVSVPAGLRRATLFQAAKDIILTQEPQSRKGFDLNELEMQITEALAPWARS